ncbi:signal peptide peptidase [Colletotrichum graminicola M1.001]|uniref:Signal peptide peptidase n=1 Tax=Colletotrichum graminicola (strain M1.001 / M2 / FGSC 10212) TaxID=645133 RepID=E3QVR8_COLGM|nr:signal peptide peptidase [Colletotrichum graminicola M1.001]EFQ34956.1 signal peptide peptidase [Colletotrichum graminicola M1.001]
MSSSAVPSPITPPFDQITGNITGNVTTSNGTSAVPEVDLYFYASLFTIEAKLIFSALATIYIGAHGSLRRPPSAAPAKRKDGERERKEDEPITEGLLPTDAILFPLLAGAMLIGLYYLIQWLQDPAILNKILRVYMSVMGVASLSTLIAHSLQVAVGFMFPNYFRHNGSLYRVDDDDESFIKFTGEETDRNNAQFLQKSNPLPFALRFPIPLNRINVNRFLWDLRHVLTDEWTVKAKVHGLFREKFHISALHVTGFNLAATAVFAYFMSGSPFLSNLMGYGFCYGSFLIMSPTNFATGSLVLMGLPYMITVATKLDVPIKLQFQSAARSSILGLGDIVVPGIVMCLALRFDMWRHYQQQIKYVPTDLKSDQHDAHSGDVVTVSETQHMAQKATYLDITGCWGDWFWSSSWLGLLKGGHEMPPPTVRGSTFRKTYFNASLIGYTLGMLVTLSMLTIFKHGQPALLYLVPGVLGSLWLTGIVRGELKEMWMYTEDGTLDTRDIVVELDGNGNVVKEIKKDGERNEEEEKKKKAEDDNVVKEIKKDGERNEEEEKKKKAEDEKALGEKDAAHKKKIEKTEYSLVSFSVTAPLRKPKTQ